MQITTSDSNDYIIINIIGRLDSGTAEEAEHWISSFSMQPGKPLIMDFAELEYISSAGLRVIFNFARSLKKSGNKFGVWKAQDHIREIFEISGFDSFIPMVNTIEEFLE
ncbi:STAS domain-containing protein [Desulfogranum marinum]|uniref:STAS domain-containing protein n=1 Tax=Desulfogranum marinum TaxID=453220 RepID=UPI00196317C5|nr:STAS domain-containing protein [Desulfogranum marinum]MBM9514975.1 STAS domain-containing protein [Desulfogranum marinum]